MPAAHPRQPAILAQPRSRRRRLGLVMAFLIAMATLSVIAFITLHRAPMPEEVMLASVERLFAADTELTN